MSDAFVEAILAKPPKRTLEDMFNLMRSTSEVVSGNLVAKRDGDEVVRTLTVRYRRPE